MTEKEVTLSFEQTSLGVAIKADGWYIATLTNQGVLRIHGGIPDSVGFKIDSAGRVQQGNE